MDTTMENGNEVLTVNSLLDPNWNNAQNNQNVLYIAVEYVKDEFNTNENELNQNFNDFEQHVSPLDPNMCSVAQYSPVYASEGAIPYNNPIVLVTSNESSEILSLPDTNGQVVSTQLLINNQQCQENQSSQNALEQNIANQEVELLITDQDTGIQYSVTKEYFVERCLSDDQQLLENLAPDSLLDTDLLTLDDGVLKSQFSDIVNLRSKDTTEFLKDDHRRALRNIAQSDPEEEMLSCVRPITDKPVPTRAFATLPETYLTIQKLSDTEVGVFAKKLIPKLTQFGPLEGTGVEITSAKTKDLDLFVEMQEGQVVKIDISDENTSNWMCFVRAAKSHKEQNLVLVEIDSALYFINKENILPKQELKVGYSKTYARKYNLQILPLLQDESNVWPCYECTEQFTSSEELQQHLDIHDEKNEAIIKKKKRKPNTKRIEYVECNACTDGELKKTRDDLVKMNWKCIHCSNVFDNETLLNAHVQKQHQDVQRDHVRNECNQKFTSEAHLQYHSDVKHENKPKKNNFDCPICHKTFATVDRRQRHMLVHGSEEAKPLQCDKCSRRFINNSALAYHLKTHVIGRTHFECPICKETFVNVLQLKSHVQSHSNNGQYTCPHCQKLFSKYSIIRKHIRAFHCERKHSCPHCTKHFPTLDKLRMHLLKHSDHREFLCADCGKQFKRKDKLKEHCKRMHSEERENAAPKFVPKVQPTDYHRFIYKCHTCMVGFKRRGMLVNHLAKRHPDISPNSVPELNLPILRATRDYYCQYCDKIYKSSSKRKAHILKNHPGAALPLSNRTHSSTSELPNPTFSQTVGSVTTHPQSCHWCYKQYASKAKLLQHLRKKHPEVLQTQNDSKESQDKSNEMEIKVTDDEIFEHLGQDYQLVSEDGVTQQNDADSRLYRLLTTTNNMAPPR